MEPNIDSMREHLKLLFDWTQTEYPNALFEVRCIKPDDRSAASPNERFPCSEDGYRQAVEYAVRHTKEGVIQHFGCDKMVKNPARVLRLAGSVSYPPRHKRERGYITELTSLT